MKTRYLPYSARRISVSEDCQIYECGVLISSENHTVKLAWVLGYRNYDVRLLKLIAWYGSYIPDYLISSIEMISDIEYTFGPDGAMCVEMEGYRHVPGYSNYVIDVDGNLYSLLKGRYLTWSVTKPADNSPGGYRYARVKADDGTSKTLFRHRALCLAWKYDTRPKIKLVVNHLNGIPGDDDLPNIEWATYSENNQHAYTYGLKDSSVVIIDALDLKTGEFTTYPSISECSRKTGVGREAIRWRLLKNDFEVFADMYVFKVHDGVAFPEIDVSKINRKGRGADIIARNVFTGDLVIFNGCNAGSKLTGVEPATILKHVREESDLPIHGYNFRYVERADSFKDHSELSLRIFKDNPVKPSFGFHVTDSHNQSTTFYTSTRDVMELTGLTKGTILRAAKDGSVLKGKYSLVKHDPRMQ